MQQIDPTTGLPIAQTPSNQMGAAKPLFNPSTMINAQNIYGSNQDRSMSLMPGQAPQQHQMPDGSMMDGPPPLRMHNGEIHNPNTFAVDQLNKVMGSAGQTNLMKDLESINRSPSTGSSLPSLPSNDSKRFSGQKVGKDNYANPGSTGSGTTINVGGDKKTTTPQYSFQVTPSYKNKGEGAEHKNKLGFYKRNDPSFEYRKNKAEGEGRTRKVKRLENRQENFQENQKSESLININKNHIGF